MQKTQHVTGRSLRVRAVSLLLAAALTLGLLPGVPGLVGTARALHRRGGGRLVL